MNNTNELMNNWWLTVWSPGAASTQFKVNDEPMNSSLKVFSDSI